MGILTGSTVVSMMAVGNLLSCASPTLLPPISRVPSNSQAVLSKLANLIFLFSRNMVKNLVVSVYSDSHFKSLGGRSLWLPFILGAISARVIVSL